MTLGEAFVDTRSSFVLAALLVSWLAWSLMLIVAGHLHHRIRRLEQAGTPTRELQVWADRQRDREPVVAGALRDRLDRRSASRSAGS